MWDEVDPVNQESENEPEEITREFVQQFLSGELSSSLGLGCDFSPNEWKKPLFECILKQELKGGEVEYDSDSLQAIGIFE